IARSRANKDLRNLMQQNPVYQQNPIAAQRLALAQQLFNARMPGAAIAERNIYGGMGNTLGAAQRNATDASQLLAVGAGAQAAANQGFEDLAFTEAQDQQRRLQNLYQAQEGQIAEGDKAYNDQVRRFGDKVGMQGMINQNRQNSWQEISNLGFGLADFSLSGGFKGLENMFKGNGSGGAQFQAIQPSIDQQGLSSALSNLPQKSTSLNQRIEVPYFLKPRNFNDPVDQFVNRWPNWLGR
ncbi:MAG TPA: hypothetical protein VFM18_09215, partial [Methanosarcina sp.]|nr:hypothetical protein [Methanosarcina sp.]